jgi:hypothetical protein
MDRDTQAQTEREARLDEVIAEYLQSHDSEQPIWHISRKTTCK